MTDAQMLQNLLSVYEGIVFIDGLLHWGASKNLLSLLKEVIAELRRRIELEEI